MAIPSSIDFGPFRASYHRELVDASFREHVDTFIGIALLPQVEHPTNRITGSLTACFDEDRYCGPKSAIRNLFRLKLTFIGPNGESSIQADVEFMPKTESFSTRRGSSLYVWTPTRRQKRQQEKEKILSVVRRIINGDEGAQNCPLCGCMLNIVNNAHIFDLLCPARCFNYNFHKDEEGNALHGHFFMSDPKDDAEQCGKREPPTKRDLSS